MKGNLTLQNPAPTPRLGGRAFFPFMADASQGDELLNGNLSLSFNNGMMEWKCRPRKVTVPRSGERTNDPGVPFPSQFSLERRVKEAKTRQAIYPRSA